jgi:hypothetical protein
VGLSWDVLTANWLGAEETLKKERFMMIVVLE